MSQDNAVDEAEWRAQEHAMRALNSDSINLASKDAQYLRVAKAIASMPLSSIPDDFASNVARLARNRADASRESMLVNLLLVIFSGCTLWVCATYSATTLHALQRAFGSEAIIWAIAGICCLSGSWLFRYLAMERQDPFFPSIGPRFD
jgi:hypothetical protein